MWTDAPSWRIGINDCSKNVNRVLLRLSLNDRHENKVKPTRLDTLSELDNELNTYFVIWNRQKTPIEEKELRRRYSERSKKFSRTS